MRRGWRSLLAACLAGCTTMTPLHAQQVNPQIPFVGDRSNQWPLWPLPTGWLVGGSGFSCS
jgi:hypothetical protein